MKKSKIDFDDKLYINLSSELNISIFYGNRVISFDTAIQFFQPNNKNIFLINQFAILRHVTTEIFTSDNFNRGFSLSVDESLFDITSSNV